GGPGLDTVCKVLVVSELARQCASTAEVIAVHTLVNDIFLKHGTEAQKQKYLTAAVEGKIGAFALTEAGAGSDAAAAKTKAVVDG
ncbi:acyl-CoA dehydrogenase family protein, partial [Intestinimonas massiliensis]